MNEMNFYTLNGDQYEVADKKARASLNEKADIKYVNQTFASAISVTDNGKAFSTAMVSPLEHNIGCQVESTNKLPVFPDASIEANGVTISYHEGIVTVNGTATKNTVLTILNNSGPTLGASKKLAEFLKTGVFYITDRFTINIFKNGAYVDYSKDHICDFSGKDFNQTNVLFSVKEGITYTNQTFGAMLNEGKAPIPYTQYVPDLTQVKISTAGESGIMFTKPFNTPETQRGVSFEILKDGSIKMKGTVEKGGISYTFAKTKKRSDNRKFTLFIPKNSGAKKWSTFWVNLKSYNDYDTMADISPVKWETDVSVNLKEGISVDTIFTPMFCLGNTKEYKVSPDGDVQGINSEFPGMSIVTNNANVSLEVTYNADTKRYIDKKFAELQAAILSTGGNV